jgi:hypothetical protein
MKSHRCPIGISSLSTTLKCKVLRLGRHKLASVNGFQAVIRPHLTCNLGAAASMAHPAGFAQVAYSLRQRSVKKQKMKAIIAEIQRRGLEKPEKRGKDVIRGLAIGTLMGGLSIGLEEMVEALNFHDGTEFVPMDTTPFMDVMYDEVFISGDVWISGIQEWVSGPGVFLPGPEGFVDYTSVYWEYDFVFIPTEVDYIEIDGFLTYGPGVYVPNSSFSSGR